MRDQAEYWRQYYAENKKRLSDIKKAKYKDDPNFRDKRIRQAKMRYQRLQQAGELRTFAFGEPLKGHGVVVDPETGITYYSMKYASKVVKVTILTIRRWEKLGIIPPSKREEIGRRWRWFTVPQIILMRKYLSKYGSLTYEQRTAVRLFVKKYWDRRAVTDGTVKETEHPKGKSGGQGSQDMDLQNLLTEQGGEE
jgi:hypothetical protein